MAQHSTGRKRMSSRNPQLRRLLVTVPTKAAMKELLTDLEVTSGVLEGLDIPPVWWHYLCADTPKKVAGRLRKMRDKIREALFPEDEGEEDY